MSELFQVDQNTITTELLKNPYGRLGGMYNILCYKHLTEHFNPEQISTTAVQNLMPEITNKTKSKSASLAKSQNTLYNQCIVLLNKVSKQQIEGRAKTANPSLVLSKNDAKLARSKEPKIQSAKPTYSKTNYVVFTRKNKEKEDSAKTPPKK